MKVKDSIETGLDSIESIRNARRRLAVSDALRLWMRQHGGEHACLIRADQRTQLAHKMIEAADAVDSLRQGLLP